MFAAGWQASEAGDPARQARGTATPALRPTEHPPLPAALDDFWLVPPSSWQPTASATIRKAMTDLGQAFSRIKEKQYAAALPLINDAVLAKTPLAGWAGYARGQAELGLKHYDEAIRIFSVLGRADSSPALAEAATVGEGEAREGKKDYAGAASVYRSLVERNPSGLSSALARLARASSAAGDRAGATSAWERLYFEYPVTEDGKQAARELAKAGLPVLKSGTPRAARELERAERLFSRRQYTDARTAFAALAKIEKGPTRELVQLRVAECDYHLRRYRQASRALRPFLTSATLGVEASYYYLSALRGLGQRAEYVKRARQLVGEHPETPWAERTLDELGSHYIIIDEDDKAEDVFLEVLDRYPSSDIAQRAGWKAGWWAYRQKQYQQAAEIFERSAARFPRSNYRPAYLYWSAKARERLGARDTAVARYRLTIADYANLYYGRRAAARLEELRVAPREGAASAGQPASPAVSSQTKPDGVDTERLGWLIRAGMYEQALAELEQARRSQADSRVVDTTRAWLYSQAGDRRTGISLMRQAYPHFMADGGEDLPEEILRVIYPLDFWPLITKYASANKLDPYLIAALMAQESAFDPAIRSSANAVGLMQLLPRTARVWARKLGLRYSASRLIDPEFSVRVGTAYFADLVRQFGGTHFALAGYNAGENRVVAWKAERKGLDDDEFIDDIPFPETQTYVKRILGIAEDYRRLYAGKSHPE